MYVTEPTTVILNRWLHQIKSQEQALMQSRKFLGRHQKGKVAYDAESCTIDRSTTETCTLTAVPTELSSH